MGGNAAAFLQVVCSLDELHDHMHSIKLAVPPAANKVMLAAAAAVCVLGRGTSRQTHTHTDTHTHTHTLSLSLSLSSAAGKGHEFSLWYQPQMTREAAEEYLRGKPDGTFVVRHSRQNHAAFVLSYAFEGREFVVCGACQAAADAYAVACVSCCVPVSLTVS